MGFFPFENLRLRRGVARADWRRLEIILLSPTELPYALVTMTSTMTYGTLQAEHGRTQAPLISEDRQIGA